MRKMTDIEIQSLLHQCNWATICTVTPDGEPYAIEATYFIDGDCLGFMINPRGRTMQNLVQNPNLLLKVTRTKKNLSEWEGISLFGTGTNVTNSEEIRKGWYLLGKVMNTDYAQVAEKFINPCRPSPYLRCIITQHTGRCSLKNSGPLR